MANLFLDRDLNKLIEKNTLSKEQFLAEQKKPEEANKEENKEQDQHE